MPYSLPMSDHLKPAREIAACTEPRFIEIKPEPRRKVRASFIEIPHQRGDGRVPFTEAELTVMRRPNRWSSVAGRRLANGERDRENAEGPQFRGRLP